MWGGVPISTTHTPCCAALQGPQLRTPWSAHFSHCLLSGHQSPLLCSSPGILLEKPVRQALPCLASEHSE